MRRGREREGESEREREIETERERSGRRICKHDIEGDKASRVPLARVEHLGRYNFAESYLNEEIGFTFLTTATE